MSRRALNHRPKQRMQGRAQQRQSHRSRYQIHSCLLTRPLPPVKAWLGLAVPDVRGDILSPVILPFPTWRII